MAKAMQVLEQSGAPPEIKIIGQRLVTELIAAGSTAAWNRTREELSSSRAERLLKYSLGWAILIAFGLLFGTAFGHTIGLWAIHDPKQLPWVWGSALGLGITGPQYLLRVFFPKR